MVLISTDVEDFNAPSIENNEQKLRFNFNSFATNAFKYDSSDNANADEVPEAAKKEVKDDNHMNSLIEYKDTLFFDSNDVRFNGMYVEIIGFKEYHIFCK